ncbi:hypothetical protein BKA64DRAFT_57979 [Cadophora sp. MPI-SDFR-AT-0126]|nr:hypothetical protein BKA64DRAFT_57979 [Leotiomycetes sp. MPI-SDFR-AT-0126]
MLFNRENGRHMDTNDAKEALAVKYDLDITVKEKSALGVDDLLLLLNHHWARDTSTFPTERHRVQFALILLLHFATGCAPLKCGEAQQQVVLPSLRQIGLLPVFSAGMQVHVSIGHFP